MTLGFAGGGLQFAGGGRMLHSARVGDFGAGPVFQFLVNGVPHDIGADALASLEVVDPTGATFSWVTGFVTVNAALGRFTRYMLPPDLNAIGRWLMRPVSAGGVEGDWFEVLVRAGFPFEPVQLPGCVLWLRADLGVTLVGGKVSLWEDQSSQGNDVSQATAGKRPTVGVLSGGSGRPALVFTTASQTHLAGALAGIGAGGDVTGFVVVRRSAGGDMAYLDTSDGAQTNRGFMMFHQATADPPILADSEIVRAGNAGGTSSAHYALNDVVSPHIYAGQHVTAQRSIVQDGVPKNTNVEARALLAPANVRVGALFQDVYFFQGEIAEVVLFSRVLTVDELLVVHAYLGQRYGIVVP